MIFFCCYSHCIVGKVCDFLCLPHMPVHPLIFPLPATVTPTHSHQAEWISWSQIVRMCTPFWSCTEQSATPHSLAWSAVITLADRPMAEPCAPQLGPAPPPPYAIRTLDFPSSSHLCHQCLLFLGVFHFSLQQMAITPSRNLSNFGVLGFGWIPTYPLAATTDREATGEVVKVFHLFGEMKWNVLGDLHTTTPKVVKPPCQPTNT